MSAEPGPRTVLVTTTVAAEDTAAELARTLVGERLAACVHVSAPITSTYVWQAKLETAREWVLQCKTTEARLAALMTRLRALHPYQVPEIVAVSATATDPDYLAWVTENTAPPSPPP
ncbi:MAG TPA: divalent-cation tolerance protein CutA [Gemmatimonadales bacterium]